MASERELVEIRKGVNDYLIKESERNKEGTFPLHELLSNAVTIYLERIQEGADEDEASTEAEEFIERKAKNTYEIVRGGSNNETLKDDELVDDVIREIIRQLGIRFRVDKRKCDSFTGKNKLISREQMYIKFVDEIVGLVPSHVITDFVLDRNEKVFVSNIHEAYLTTQHNYKRTKTYFMLMYATLEDPKIYNPASTRNVNWGELNLQLFKHIVDGKKFKDMVSVPQTTLEYYNNIRRWNQNTNHNKRDENLFWKTYIGAIALRNNIFPEGRQTKAMDNVKKRLYSYKFREEREGVKVNPIKYVENTENKLRFSGVAIIKIGDVYFIVGKELYIVEDKRGDLVIREVLPYSRVTPKTLDKYAGNDLK